MNEELEGLVILCDDSDDCWLCLLLEYAYRQSIDEFRMYYETFDGAADFHEIGDQHIPYNICESDDCAVCDILMDLRSDIDLLDSD